MAALPRKMKKISHVSVFRLQKQKKNAI